jgi:DNA-binding NarL/FixJ family response regulator
MGLAARPLVVIEGRTGLLGQPMAEALAAARRDGWEIVRGWNLPAGHGRVVCSGTIRGPEDAGLARRAVHGGAGLVVAASAARVTVDRLLTELRRHGTVRHVRDDEAHRAAHLTEQERALLALLAEGLTIDEAAGELRVTAGVARRRVATARRRLGAASPSAALAAALLQRR